MDFCGGGGLKAPAGCGASGIKCWGAAIMWTVVAQCLAGR